jgi:thiamine-phosphate pyrophosphorylase
VLSLSGVYAITDDVLLPGNRLFTAVEAALASGVRLLQYRSKAQTANAREQQALALRQLTARYQAALIINDDTTLAAAVNADGVHLGQRDGSVAAARAVLGDGAIIGRTCHADLDLALQAQREGASYVAFGRFFPSKTKPDAPPATIDLLRQARSSLQLPIVAIGGINAENGAALIESGADMLAVIHSLFGSDQIAASAAALVALFENAENQPSQSTQ